MKKTDDDLITQGQAAELRSVSVAAINELMRRGRLPYVEKYGRRLVRRADVLAFEPKTHKKRAATKPAKRGGKK